MIYSAKSKAAEPIFGMTGDSTTDALWSILVLLDTISSTMCVDLQHLAPSFDPSYFLIRYQICAPSKTVYMCVKMDNSQNLCANQYLYTSSLVENDIRIACT